MLGLRRIGARHLTTKPYRPRTNGKAERFIQTALREWRYAKAYTSSQQKTLDMPAWLHPRYGILPVAHSSDLRWHRQPVTAYR